jgi:hypothetical protein
VALVDDSMPKRAEELDGFAAIYLESPAYEMSPEQIRAISDYSRHGRVICTSKDIKINGSDAIPQIGGDRVMIWDAQNPLTPTLPIASDDGLQANLRFAIYQKPNRLTVHAVNYNVCLRSAKKAVLDAPPTAMAVPVPTDWKGAAAVCFSPESNPEKLQCTIESGVARFTLPKLHIYKLVLLERVTD